MVSVALLFHVARSLPKHVAHVFLSLHVARTFPKQIMLSLQVTYSFLKQVVSVVLSLSLSKVTVVCQNKWSVLPFHLLPKVCQNKWSVFSCYFMLPGVCQNKWSVLSWHFMLPGVCQNKWSVLSCNFMLPGVCQNKWSVLSWYFMLPVVCQKQVVKCQFTSCYMEFAQWICFFYSLCHFMSPPPLFRFVLLHLPVLFLSWATVDWSWPKEWN